MLIRSPYTPYSIYLSGTISSNQGLGFKVGALGLEVAVAGFSFSGSGFWGYG